ncbi:MAG: PilZ domain-containing protein [Thermodesulfobacteriota bacterium]
MAQDISFTVGGDDSQRRAFRAKVPGLKVAVPDRSASYDVMDLSAMGLAFRDDAKSFKENTIITFDLYLNDKVFLAELTARVMRMLDNGLVGCNFEGNDHRKEARLDKLVLEVQKRLIALRKKARE